MGLPSFPGSFPGSAFTGAFTSAFTGAFAGDTFFAAFIIEYLNTKNILTSIIFANKCAAITVKKIGAEPITKEEIKEIRNDIRI